MSNDSLERWKPIPGYEGMYEASDRGSIRSVTRHVPHPHGKGRTYRGRQLSMHRNKRGYVQVGLSKNGAPAYCLVHRLVLEAFVGPCPEGMEACHNDGNPSNNTAANLRWDTRSENARDRVRHGRPPTWIGKSHCKRGHEFTPENTILRDLRPGDDRRGRECRACAQMHARNHWQRRLATRKAVAS